MAKEALEAIKNLTKEELLTKMKTEENFVPRDKAERQEFIEFINKTPEDREKYLAGIQDPKPESKEPKGEPADPKPVVQPVPESSKVDLPPPPADLLKELGYEDTQKAIEAHRTLLSLNERLQKTVDSLNAREGKRGSELKVLKEREAALLAEIETFKKANPEAGAKGPERPKRPNPKDFPDGRFDEKYADELDKYELAMETYESEKDAFIRRQAVEEAKKVLTPPQAVTAEPFDASSQTLWDGFYNQDIPDFQKRMSLETTVPIRRISDNYNTIHDTRSTADQRAVAEAFVASLPATDRENYKKVKTAVETAYNFSTGVPVPKYRKIETALEDYDLVGEGKLFNSVKPTRLSAAEENAAREAARLKSEAAASAPPASSSAAGDKNLSSTHGPEQKQDRLKELLTAYNKVVTKGNQSQIAKFEQSPEFKEYLTLRQELTGRIPSYAKG
jgi:hypothetical protein